MRHYRCRDCGEGFSVEPLSDVHLPGEVRCVFCGECARAIVDTTGMALATSEGRARIGSAAGERARKMWAAAREAR